MDVKRAIACMLVVRKVKQTELGRRLGYVSRGSMSMLMSRKKLSVDNLVRIAKVLGYQVILRPVPGQPGLEYMVDETGEE